MAACSLLASFIAVSFFMSSYTIR